MLVLGFSLNVTCSVLDEICLMDNRAFLAGELGSTPTPPTATPALILEADAATKQLETFREIFTSELTVKRRFVDAGRRLPQFCIVTVVLRLRSLFVKTDWVCHVWCHF